MIAFPAGDWERDKGAIKPRIPPREVYREAVLYLV
ncbi:hypothetical protein Anacy_5270 [Anabaena cylindrica PCC 7122]|uniref:Uncharacterized protein n=1 Tax=Anabaena cylindrica (strain ATCC 27899 / PCC 7122) TaxID=272123 RepID=K9ZN12_ANACC|nr:hypothetical protein Anacy_5270 [Anabaena cylindrica PCC 7122]BAY02320.1 hypothetical protein NIES19_15630 [Anabaena cylindrica PCC 7122]